MQIASSSGEPAGERALMREFLECFPRPSVRRTLSLFVTL